MGNFSTKLMKIAFAVFVRNDLALLARTMPYWVNFVDTICVLDMASTDGTEEYCRDFLAPQVELRYHREETNWIPIKGFAKARNLLLSIVPEYIRWTITGGADGLIPFAYHSTLKHELAEHVNSHLVLAMPCLHVKPPKEFPELSLPVEQLVRAFDTPLNRAKAEAHRRIVSAPSMDYRGYLHEEPYIKSDGRETGSAPRLVTPFVHLERWTNDYLRLRRLAWMFCNAADHPELQAYTNRYWYETHFKECEPELRRMALEYNPHLDEGIKNNSH